MRIAFVTDELPRPGLAGHLALNYAIIEWLRGLGHEVVVLLVGSRLALPVERYGVAAVAGPRVRAMGDFVVSGAPGVMARALVRALPARLAARMRRVRLHADAVLGSFTSPADIAWCARYITQARPDAVLIDTIFRAGLLAAPAMAGINSVVIAHDVFHRRHLALVSAGYAVQPRQLTRADEAAWLCGARHIAAIQPDEATLLAAMCPMQNVFLLSMPASPVAPPAGAALLPGRLVFVGSASLPNLDGLRWFLAEIWPLLHGRGITLDLVGDCGASLRGLPSGVTRVGRVAALAPYLHRAALGIAPLRAGSGLKIKLLDYARHGLMTVATPASLEGFAPDVQAPFIRAEGPEAFAAAILRALEQPPAPKRAMGYVVSHYGMEASFAGLAQALIT